MSHRWGINTSNVCASQSEFLKFLVTKDEVSWFHHIRVLNETFLPRRCGGINIWTEREPSGQWALSSMYVKHTFATTLKSQQNDFAWHEFLSMVTGCEWMESVLLTRVLVRTSPIRTFLAKHTQQISYKWPLSRIDLGMFNTGHNDALWEREIHRVVMETKTNRWTERRRFFRTATRDRDDPLNEICKSKQLQVRFVSYCFFQTLVALCQADSIFDLYHVNYYAHLFFDEET